MSESSATDRGPLEARGKRSPSKGGAHASSETRATAQCEVNPDDKLMMVQKENISATASSIDPTTQSTKHSKKEETTAKKRKRKVNSPEKPEVNDRKGLASMAIVNRDKKVKSKLSKKSDGVGTRNGSKSGAVSDADEKQKSSTKKDYARSQTLRNNPASEQSNIQTNSLNKPKKSAGPQKDISEASPLGFGTGMTSSATKSDQIPSGTISSDETESKRTLRIYDEPFIGQGLSQKQPASPASLTFDYLAQKSEFINDANTSPFASPMITQDSIPATPLNLMNAEMEITQFSIKPVKVTEEYFDQEASIEAENTIIAEKVQEVKKRSIIKVNHADLPDAVPLLPKQTNYISGPPKCPMDSIKFIQLKRFQANCESQAEKMNSGFELVGHRRKLLQLRTMEKVEQNKKGNTQHENPKTVDNPHGFSDHAKMDGTTHFIKNIVYARDPTILDRETMHVNQRAAFSHENNLDVKKMMHKQQAFMHDDTMSYRMAALQRSPMMRGPAAQQRLKPRPLDAQLYHPTDENDKTLVFESRFESGNLYLSQKVSDTEYNLLMQNDVNTQGHTQWFFYRVQNTKAGHRVKFNILNYSKPDSLFNYGMKVSIYSEKGAEASKLGWHKGGEDISYQANGIRKDVFYSSKSFYTASFTYKFKHSGDSVFFAYSQPYTYSDLRDDLAQIEANPDRSQYVTTKPLCTTLAGNTCDYLTITSKSKEVGVLELNKRKSVIITGRVHPGETVGSHMMKGVLDFLTDPLKKEARLLRENFVFKVIPMLNPDGVINGNYRCSLAGCDLNRRWKNPSKLLHPTIYYTKKLVKQQHEERQVLMFCDLHGHSRKQNVFMYGCNRKENPGATRVLPFLMSKINPFFCFADSRFGNQKSKESTARISLFKELRSVHCIFTMESSFAGVDTGKHAGLHFTAEMLGSIGRDLCRSVLAYSNIFIPEELRQLPMFKRMLQGNDGQVPPGKKDFTEDKEGQPVFNVFDGILDEFKENASLLEQTGGDSSSGSDDMPSEDNLQVEDLAKQLPPDKVIKQEVKKKKEEKKEELEPKKKEIKKKEPTPPPPPPKKEEPRRADPSPMRKPAQPFVRKEEPEVKKEEPKKKPEMKDAWTQTEKSATADYKQKLQKERQRLYAQQQQQEAFLRNPQYHTSAAAPQKRDSGGAAKVNPVLNTPPSYSQLKGGSLKQNANAAKFFDQNVTSPQHATYPFKNASGQQPTPANAAANQGFLSLNGFNKRHVSNNSYGASGSGGQAANIAFNSMQKAQYENRVGHGQQSTSNRAYQQANSDRGQQLSASGQNIIAPGSPSGGGRAGQNLMMQGDRHSDRKTNQQTFNVSHAQQALAHHQNNMSIGQNAAKSPSHFQNFVGQRPPHMFSSAGAHPSPTQNPAANHTSAFAAQQQYQYSTKGKESAEGGPRRHPQHPSKPKEKQPGIAVIGSSSLTQMQMRGGDASSAMTTNAPGMDTRSPLEVSPQQYAQDFKDQVLQKHAHQAVHKPLSTQQFQIPLGKTGGGDAYAQGVPNSNNRTRGYKEQVVHSGKVFGQGSSSQARLNVGYMVPKATVASSHNVDGANPPNMIDQLNPSVSPNYRQKPKPSPNQRQAQIIHMRQAAAHDSQQIQLRSSQPSKQSPQLHHALRATSDIKIPQQPQQITSIMLQQNSFVNSNMSVSISNPPGSRGNNRTQSQSNQKFHTSAAQLEHSPSKKGSSGGATIAKTTDSSTRLPHLQMRQIPKDNSSDMVSGESYSQPFNNQRVHITKDSPSIQSVLQHQGSTAKKRLSAHNCYADTQPTPVLRKELAPTDSPQITQAADILQRQGIKSPVPLHADRILHNMSESGNDSKHGIAQPRRNTFDSQQPAQVPGGLTQTERPQSSPQPPPK